MTHGTRYGYKAGCRCEPCSAAGARYNASYNAAHRKEAHARSQKRASDRKRFVRELDLWKHTQGCCWCGDKEGRLYYHHVDPNDKWYNVSALLSMSLRHLLDEIAKCVVMCHQCHSRYHAMLRECGK